MPLGIYPKMKTATPVRMERFLSIVLLTGVAAVAMAQDPSDYHRSAQDLTGNVRSMIEKSFRAQTSDQQADQKKLIVHDTYTYNQEGYLLEATHANADGLIWTDMNTYDDQGNRVVELRNDPQQKLIYKNTFQYDNQGNQIEKVIFNYMDKPVSRITSTFTKTGDIQIIKKANIPGKAKIIVENIYDDKGRLIEERMSDLAGPVKIINMYDNAGNKTESKLYDSRKRLLERETYSYDTNGKLIENIIYGEKDMLASKIRFAYDEKGNLSEKSRFDADGQILERDRHEFKYDASDNLLWEKHHRFYIGTEESSEGSEYAEFDDKGNWRRKLLSRDGSPQMVIERQIEYHESTH
jgi:hypothetical protein